MPRNGDGPAPREGAGPSHELDRREDQPFGVEQVPPFIAVKVVLRSGDGATYELSDGRRIVKVGAGKRSGSFTIDGLKTGARVALKGPQGDILIIANAEPGP